MWLGESWLFAQNIRFWLSVWHRSVAKAFKTPRPLKVTPYQQRRPRFERSNKRDISSHIKVWQVALSLSLCLHPNVDGSDSVRIIFKVLISNRSRKPLDRINSWPIRIYRIGGVWICINLKEYRSVRLKIKGMHFVTALPHAAKDAILNGALVAEGLKNSQSMHQFYRF